MPTEKTELREAGYADLRDAIDPRTDPPDPWAYVELRDEDDEAITRIDVDDDDRGSWSTAEDGQVLRAELEIAADDDDIEADEDDPVTITATASYAEEEDGDEKAWDDMHEVTLAHEDDEVVITHQIEIPEVE